MATAELEERVGLARLPYWDIEIIEELIREGKN